MKQAIFLVTFLASLAAAQSLPPSPTASVGCESHGDHWHCDGPASVFATISSTTATLSVTVTSSTATTTTSHAHGDHDHDDDNDDHDHDDDHGDEATGSLPPSPTASVGCEPHGDHWHCDGPALTPAGENTESTSVPNAALAMATGRPAAAVVGGLMALAFGAAI